jgi:2-oxoglutarate ferredoxin oxidoreductase subunit alpha
LLKIIELENVVIKFAGDSGDGMQMTGTQFSDSSALFGNDLSTFPDYPSEIRAPHGTIAGVSGFQVHIGKKKVQTPGDFADILVAMNPAALKANQKWLRPGSTIIIDADSFDEKNFELAGYTSNPLENGSLKEYNIVKAPITSLSAEAASAFGLDKKTIDKTRNQFVVGILYWLFNREIETAVSFIKNRFKKKPEMIEPNLAVLHAGFNFAENVEAMTTQFHVKPAKKEKGLFRNITGNQATAWGLLAASERSGRKLFLGSYPITPASEILQELSTMKHLDCVTFQAEDEIAGICSAIGASFAGHLGTTSTSGPGLALKGEAIGLAVMTELPLVIVNVQRGGPATGLPTKTEQSDLMQALYGRNGESPVVVMAATTPANCFEYAYKACKITLEHMTPVILLTDGYLGNGSELWKIPDVNELPEITPRLVKDNDTTFKPYLRDAETLARSWAIPGQEGLRHRVGGLEKEHITGVVSHDPANHQLMVTQRAEKVERVANFIPDQTIFGKEHSDLLVVGWGGTYGALLTAVKELQEEGYNISLCQFSYIQPLPKNTGKVLANHKKRLVCELNMGQFANYLRMKFPHLEFSQYNKIQGLPFFITELKEKFKAILEGK